MNVDVDSSAVYCIACLEGDQPQTALRKGGQYLLGGGGEVARQEVQISVLCRPRVQLGDGLRYHSAPNFDSQMIPTPPLWPVEAQQRE